jgi:glycosyltransferase involved in cell wall biosynthesis
MKIVIPVHHFPPKYSAGAELYTSRLAHSLAVQGHQVDVVCIEAIDRGESNELVVTEDTYNGITVWRLEYNMLGSQNRNHWSYDNPLLRDWFKTFIARTQPDIVHFQAGYLIGIAPLEVVAACGIPTVLTLHDYWYLCPRITLLRGDGSLCESIPEDPVGCAWCQCLESRRYRIPNRLTGGLLGIAAQSFTLNNERDLFAMRRAHLLSALALPNVVIAPSRFLANLFAPFVKPGQLQISPLGLNFDPSLARHRPAHDDVLRIGFTGQIAPHKGVHLLIKAFRRLRTEGRPVELHIYGGLDTDPEYVKRLRQLAGNDPRIYFHGRFENSRALDILVRLDITVTPSIWYENYPLAILESRAAGTPVITARHGGMAELVRDGVDGLHFRPGDAVGLAHQIQRLIDEPSLLDHLQSHITPPRSIEDEMSQLMEIYYSLVPQIDVPGKRCA